VTLVSIFFIILITAFAVVAFFTEPSKADKLIHSRLASLDRKRVSSGTDEPDIVKEITFSTIPAFDKFLRNNRAAVGLQLLIEQSVIGGLRRGWRAGHRAWRWARSHIFSCCKKAIGGCAASRNSFRKRST